MLSMLLFFSKPTGDVLAHLRENSKVVSAIDALLARSFAKIWAMCDDLADPQQHAVSRACVVTFEMERMETQVRSKTQFLQARFAEARLVLARAESKTQREVLLVATGLAKVHLLLQFLLNAPKGLAVARAVLDRAMHDPRRAALLGGSTLLSAAALLAAALYLRKRHRDLALAAQRVVVARESWLRPVHEQTPAKAGRR